MSVVGIVIAVALAVVVIVAIIGGYLFHGDWTGLSKKTLWDWLPLLVVPVMLAVGGFWLNQIQKSREETRASMERSMESYRQEETRLQAYIDKMSELLLKEHLRQSQPEDEVRKIARTRTWIVLHGLDLGKRSVLQFLQESDLINKDKPIVDLNRARIWQAMLFEMDLRQADLSGAELWGSNFEGAFLCDANLSGANLSGANLSGANLTRADLSGANLKDTTGITIEELEKEALSLKGVTMPDGSKHP